MNINETIDNEFGNPNFQELFSKYNIHNEKQLKADGVDLKRSPQTVNSYSQFLDAFKRNGYTIDGASIFGKNEDEEFVITNSGLIWDNWDLIKFFKTPQELEQWVKNDREEFMILYRRMEEIEGKKLGDIERQRDDRDRADYSRGEEWKTPSGGSSEYDPRPNPNDDTEAERSWREPSDFTTKEDPPSSTSNADDLNSLDDDKIIRIVTKYIKEKHKINSDKVIDIYNIAKERKSNKLVNFVKSLTHLVKESKKPSMNIRTELLEVLIRQCAREVISQIKEINGGKDSDFHRDEKGVICKYCGSPAKTETRFDGEPIHVCINKQCVKGGGKKTYRPFREAAEGGENPPPTPVGDQGNVDPSPVPQDKPQDKPQEPKRPEPQSEPISPKVKGAVLVNPRDKSKLQPIKFQGGDDASLERLLYRTAASVAGPKVKVALATIRVAREAARNSNAAMYFYIGKYDPESEELFLMADRSLQVAKDASVQPSELNGTSVPGIPPTDYDPLTANVSDITAHMDQRGHTPVRGSGIDEEFYSVIKQLVNEILDRK